MALHKWPPAIPEVFSLRIQSALFSPGSNTDSLWERNLGTVLPLTASLGLCSVKSPAVEVALSPFVVSEALRW